ncbi:MAG: hypothetical protein Q7K26_01360 [bacterium]|nr:hypothetical protein [bacterium]
MSWDSWVAAVERELIQLGFPVLDAKHVVPDHTDWFEREFNGSESAAITAGEWFNDN